MSTSWDSQVSVGFARYGGCLLRRKRFQLIARNETDLHLYSVCCNAWVRVRNPSQPFATMLANYA